MMRKTACIGDTTSTGGSLLPYAGQSFRINGRQAAIIGGRATCPACKSVGLIAKAGGPRRATNAEGNQIALEGDVVLCKCTKHPVLVSSASFALRNDDMGLPGMDYSPDVLSAEWFSSVVKPATATPLQAASATDTQHDQYDQHFQLCHLTTGEPLANYKYRMSCNGVTIEAYTDENGLTEKISAERDIDATLEILQFKSTDADESFKSDMANENHTARLTHKSEKKPTTINVDRLGISDTQSIPSIASRYDATFGHGSKKVGDSDSKSTWAIKYKPVLERYEKENPFEVDLFRSMLQTIPSYVVGNESTWASVIYGFDTYARKQAILVVGAEFAGLENDIFGLRGIDPKSWFDRLTASRDLLSVKKLTTDYEAAVIMLRAGPQVFNQAWYEGIWGSPPQPWSSYAPGWTPAKLEAK